MKKTYVKNLGLVCTGDINNPISDAKAIYAEDGVIKYMGAEDAALEAAADTVIDGMGFECCPALIDAQVHVPLMDYMAEFKVSDFAVNFMAGGTGGMVNVGNGTPAMPTTVAGAKAVAIAGEEIWKSYAPKVAKNAKVHGGALTLVDGMTEADIAEVAAAGVKVLAECGKGPVKDVNKLAEYAKIAKKHGMVVTAHSGGACCDNCANITADDLLKINPDVICSLNGAPTPMTEADIDKVLAGDFYYTLVPHGNLGEVLKIAEKAMKAGKLGKLLAGSNTPHDGYTVLGTWIIVAALADKFQDVHPATFIALASGNVADAYGLDHGKLAVGYKLDMEFLGGYGYDEDAMGTLKAGMIPASGCMVLDGKRQMTRHKNVPALAADTVVTTK